MVRTPTLIVAGFLAALTVLSVAAAARATSTRRSPGRAGCTSAGVEDIARQADGKIVVGGSIYEDEAVARFRTR